MWERGTVWSYSICSVLIGNMPVSGIPKTMFSDSLEGLNRTQCIVVLMDKVYFSKGKRCIGWKSGRNQVQDSKSLLPVESHKLCLIPLAAVLWQYMWSVVCQRSSLETQCPDFFTGSWFSMHLLPNLCPNARLLERKKTSV